MIKNSFIAKSILPSNNDSIIIRRKFIIDGIHHTHYSGIPINPISLPIIFLLKINDIVDITIA